MSSKPRVQPEDVVDRWAFERSAWDRGFMRLAGVDEAGRGPLAGPVVAAAVLLPAAWAGAGLPNELQGLNDSKKVPAARRERYFQFLLSCVEIARGVGIVDASSIDRINILQATYVAMNEALSQIKPSPDHVLVDGNHVPTIALPQTSIVSGDSLSYSIAAASILAKVTRDHLMVEFDRLYPGYGFAVHKGYPTPQHLAALATQGPSPIHRVSFAPVRAVQGEFSFPRPSD